MKNRLPVLIDRTELADLQERASGTSQALAVIEAMGQALVGLQHQVAEQGVMLEQLLSQTDQVHTQTRRIWGAQKRREFFVKHQNEVVAE